MARIAVTGAAGNVGREALDALRDDHDVTALTHSEHDDIDSRLFDLEDEDDVHDALAGHDTVVHLAAAAAPDTDWDTAVDVNVRGTQTVFEAAVENDLDRVVFASSNHATGTYNIDDPSDPESMTPDDVRTIDPDDPPRPDSFYGVSKVAGEALASYYADRHGVESVSLRIGWYMSRDDLRETQDAPEEKAQFARAMWLSPRDCRDAVVAAVESEIPENPLTVNAVSANDARYLSLTRTLTTIGYTPRDNSGVVLEEDENVDVA